MAIKSNYDFKGISIADAYIRIDRLWGSSKENWTALVGVYNLTEETVPAVPSVDAVLDEEGNIVTPAVEGIDATTNTITFAATGAYAFNFVTSDGGTTITVSEVNKKLQPFNNSQEDLAASAAISLATTVSYFTTAAAETATLADGATLTVGTGIANAISLSSVTGTASGTASNLTIYTTGAVTIGGAVGTDIGTITITNSGGTTFSSTVDAATVARSEEHTSELQSH